MLYTLYHYDMSKYTYSFGKWYNAETREECDAPTFEEYRKIALVDVGGLEDVFFETNHISGDWTQGRFVQMIAKGGHRSSSCGDIVEDKNGQKWICAFCGWEKFEENEISIQN